MWKQLLFSGFIFCGCQILTSTAAAAPACGSIFSLDPSPLAVDDLYLWDNWIVRNPRDNSYLRYSLSAPTTVGSSDNRHLHARIRVFSSTDQTHWKDQGIALAKEGLSWSGHTFLGTDGKYRLFHTKSEPLPDGNVVQRIALATSSDGIHFGPSHIILDPLRLQKLPEVRAEAYHFGQGDGLVMAFRDPYFSSVDEVLYFATKMRLADQRVIPAVGRAKFIDGGWRLLPPLRLPVESTIRQIEVPNVVRLPSGKVIMSVNLTDRARDSSPTFEVRSWVRIFELDPATGEWLPAHGKSLDAQGNLFTPEDRIYGFNLVTNGHSLSGAGFYRTGGRAPHALTPVMKIEIDE